jgi:autotransporter translocation and assembly factor TamB
MLDAEIALAGTGREPIAGARLHMTFPEVEELANDRLSLRALWAGPNGDPSTLDLFEDHAEFQALLSELPHGGVAVRGQLERGGKPLAHAYASLPLDQDASSPRPEFGPKAHLRYDVSAEPLRLGEWNALAPPGTELRGEVYLDAQGDGPVEELPIDATLRLAKARFEQSFGSSATVDGEITIGGTSAAPDIKGRLRVPSALVRLPDHSRELHPVKGEARLWDLPGMSPDRFAALDTLQIDWGWSFASEDTTEVENEEPILTLAESTKLDVNVEIPNSFWIRGRGLEVQLAGELHLELIDGVPRVVGELRAIGGSIEIAGARLRMDNGTVTFYGGDTADPSLDLRLSRSEGEVRVYVNVTGTAQEPNIEFDSDPSMSQADIMSYLLFGGPTDGLDGAQTQLLQDQAAAALSQFASPLLENELTESLGISMLQLQAGQDPEDGLSLVVGKYVTPQILLKYEQSLKDREKYTVNAEYWLNQNFRVETQLSESQSTGILLNWSNDY